MTLTQDHNEEPADDMPPLVEPPLGMTYTFLTEMPPLSWDTTPSDPTATIEELDSFEQSHTFPGPMRTYHGKRRDASYIPRPPNAFILFRSSFIREQQVPINVEGNHSNLSKIVGMYWKNLPKFERDTWEAKAAQAQVEHRRRYPDWRFQPGANAAANAKQRRYVLDRGGGRGRRKLSMSTKDPPDRARDGEAQELEDEDEEEDIDNDDDSDYEEGVTSRKKGKGKRKAGTMKAHSMRGRLPTRKAKTERVKSIAKAGPATPRDKEKDKERVNKIVGFLVEGKKGAELEEAVEAWERHEGKLSINERQSVDEDDDESSSAVNKVDIPCNTTANLEHKFRTKPLPLIITVNPAPPSAPSPTPASTPRSPALSLLSPALTLSPSVAPPSSPESYHVEWAQGQAHGFKRSSSAPAPGMRVGVPRVQNKMQGVYTYGNRRGQLGRRNVQGHGNAQGGTGMRKRHCSSASVPGSIGSDSDGERNKEMPRRETVSVLLPLRRMDACFRKDGESQTDTIYGPVKQKFGVQEQGSPSMEGYDFGEDGGHMSTGLDSSVVSDMPSASTTASNTTNFYYPDFPVSSLSAVAPSQRHQQEQHTYTSTSMSLWPPVDSRFIDAQCQPLREGSFEQPYEWYTYGYGTSGGVEYGKVYDDMERTYFPLEAERGRDEYTAVMQGKLEHEHEHEHENEQRWSTSPTKSKSIVDASSPSKSSLASTPQAHQISTSTDETVNTGTDAGGFFCPLVPCRISVPPSKFSSLTGWDGSKSEEGAEEDSRDVGSAGGAGIDVCGGEEAQGQGLGSWYGWGTIQSVGLHDVGRWDDTAAGMGAGSGTSGGEGVRGASGDGGARYDGLIFKGEVA